VIDFSARKFGLFTIRGTIQLARGEFTVADPITRSTVHAVLAADTFRTPMARRDEHVKSDKLLDVVRFPTIEFTGDGLIRTPSGWSVGGTLTVHGRRHQAELAIGDLSEDEGGTVRLRATAQVDRNDFAVTGMRVAAGPKVDISIDTVAIRI
jgi:polyisoprenoid-binding protein YceI